MGIENWSTTPGSNDSSPPDGWPEGMAPSDVNNTARQGMASVRTWYEDAEWINFGHTNVYVGATQFKVEATDVTSTYTVNRRVKLVAATPGTIYGIITASVFSTDTTVTVTWDSGSLSNETITSVSVASIKGGSSAQSIDITGVKGASTSINSNIIINGNMDIAQRGTSFAAVTNQDYTLDRHLWGQSGAGVVTITQDSASVPDGSEFALKVDVTTADASLAAGDVYYTEYRVEGKDAAVIKFGTSSAESITLSFYVRSTVTGTYHVSFRNSASDRSYPASYTIDSADTWEKKTITLTADTGGTWFDSEGVIGLSINFTIASGSTFEGTANAWQAGTSFSASGAANGMSSASNNFHITQVKLELGDTATTFQLRPIAQELELAKRYFERLDYTSTGVQFIGSGYARATSQAAALFNYTEKMQVPSFTGTAAGTFSVRYRGSNTPATSISFDLAGTKAARALLGTAAVLTAGDGIILSRDATDTTYIDVDSEL